MNYRRCVLTMLALGCLLTQAPTALAQDWIYRFQSGDTLWDLCIRYSNKSGCWIALGKHNDIADDKAIRPGDDIRFPLVWLTQTPVVGQVASVRGDVSYHANSAGPGAPLTAGQSLLLGSRLVSRDGSAQITLGSTKLLLRPASGLLLDNLGSDTLPGRSAELSLDAGDVDVEVVPRSRSRSRSRFEIRTPSAIAAVRGTRYRVSSFEDGGASTRSEVLAGAVEVRGVGAKVVPAGFGLLAQKGRALGKPRELLPPPVPEQARVDAPLPLTVRWQADPGAVSWELDLQRGQKGGELLASYSAGTPEIILTGLAEACYQLVLRGVDAAGFNGLDRNLPLCVIPRLPAPPRLAIERPDEAQPLYRAAWSAVPAASQYRLELAGDDSFGQLLSSQVVAGPVAEFTLPGVERFSARVTAIDQHGNVGTNGVAVDYVEPSIVVPLTASALVLLLILL